MKNFNIPKAFLCLLVTLFSLPAFAQICQQGMVMNFKTNSAKLLPSEKEKLDSLIKLVDRTGGAYLEVLGHTDQRGSDEFNLKLAGDRIGAVKEYLAKNAQGRRIEIEIYNMGESRPLYTGADEEMMSQNRRVEVFFFPFIKGTVQLREKTGASISLSKDYFAPCGICAKAATTTEVLTGDKVSDKIVSMINEDGMPLVTAGLVRLDRDCAEQKDSCAKALIRIPGEKDPKMKIYAFTGQYWIPREETLEYDEKTREYVMNANFCNKVWLSICKPAVRSDVINVTLPKLNRMHPVMPYLGEMNTLELTASTETQAVTGCKDCQWTVKLNDTGKADNGYLYYFDGLLKPAYRSTEKEVSYYALTLSDYRPIVNYTEDVVVVKLPKYYARKVKLYLPDIDSAINIKKYERKPNKFTTKIPAHNYAFTFNPSRKENYRVDSGQLKLKFKKRKNIYLAKVKKRALREQMLSQL